MKTLIVVLFLLSGVAWGQVDTIAPNKYWNGHCGYNFPCVHPIYVAQDGRVREAPSFAGFLALWDEWKDSCWADSTEYERHVGAGPYSRCIKTCDWTCGPCETAGHYDEKAWNHRNPDNLPAFMEFIRRRTK